MSDFSFFCVGPDALPHLPMPPGYHFSRKNTAAADNAASLHISLLHTNKRKTSELCQNSTKTTQTYPLFSFIFPVFLSVFIHFYLFFHIFLHIPCCRYFCVSFFVFVSAAAGECGRQAGPGRGSGVYGRQIVCTVCVVEEQKPSTTQCGCSHCPACKPRSGFAGFGLPAKLRFVFFF